MGGGVIDIVICFRVVYFVCFFVCLNLLCVLLVCFCVLGFVVCFLVCVAFLFLLFVFLSGPAGGCTLCRVSAHLKVCLVCRVLGVIVRLEQGPVGV